MGVYLAAAVTNGTGAYPSQACSVVVGVETVHSVSPGEFCLTKVVAESDKR